MNIVPRRFFLDDLFNDFDEGSIKPVNMKCDIYEKEGNYCIEMDLPGYDKKDIDIDFDNMRREEVIDYVSNKYGKYNTARIRKQTKE